MRPESRIKGWCPGAWRPMRSGDGLILRVRPPLARLSHAQALGLCALAERFGSGMMQITNRGNLQLRGLSERTHAAALEGLAALELLAPDAGSEARGNLLVAPDWHSGDLTQRLARRIAAALPHLPALPAKVGVAVDCGTGPVLGDDPADFRLERSAEGGVILRADTAPAGRAVCETEVVPALREMMEWFDRHRSDAARRMAAVLRLAPLPAPWCTARSAAPRARPVPGTGTDAEAGAEAGAGSENAAAPPRAAAAGALWLAVPFGMMTASELRAELEAAPGDLRISPWRMLRLGGATRSATGAFIARPDDPRLGIDACPGAPFCSSAEIATRPLARALSDRAGRLPDIHVSGCAKGCARPRRSAVTLVGRGGLVDLVRDGAAWDEPAQSALTPDQISRMTL